MSEISEARLGEIEALLARVGPPIGRGFTDAELDATRTRVLEIAERIGVAADITVEALVRHAYGFHVAKMATHGLVLQDGRCIPLSEDTIAAHVHDYMAERERVLVQNLSVADLVREVRRLREENERMRAEVGRLTAERRADELAVKLDGAIVVRDDEATRERIARACFEFDRGETWSERTNSDEKTYTEEADAVLAALLDNAAAAWGCRVSGANHPMTSDEILEFVRRAYAVADDHEEEEEVEL